MDRPIGLAGFDRQWDAYRDDYLAAVDRVGRSGWLILGKEVEAFEKDLASWLGVPFAVGVGNGLDALEISFRALGARPGDVYLTTPLSAFATTLAILRAGGVPLFADVDASGLLSLESAEEAIRAAPRPPRFLVPVHLYGHAASLTGLSAFARRHGLRIVEDAAQSIGARSDGTMTGTAGAINATSFYPTKNLGALGDGGAVLTADPELRKAAACLRDYGQTDKYVHDLAGSNSRLDELHAAMLRSVQLPRLAGHTERRRAIARAFLDGLDRRRLVIPPVPSGSESVWHLFPVLVDGDRDSFRAHMNARGVLTGLHYPKLIPHQEAIVKAGLPRPEGSWPMAERFAAREVSLPMHPFLEDGEVRRVIDAANGWKG